MWQFSKECPAPPPGTWFPAEIRAAAFFAIFLAPRFFDRIVIWGTHELSNRRAFKIDRKIGYRVITTIEKALAHRRAIEDACVGAGHMSILFVPRNIDEFLQQVNDLYHYAKPTSITIGTGGGTDPLGDDQDIAFLESNLFHNGDHIFTFSHDADYLFEIFRE
jgi:hypothetical protein